MFLSRYLRGYQKVFDYSPSIILCLSFLLVLSSANTKSSASIILSISVAIVATNYYSISDINSYVVMMININTTKMLLCIIDGRHPNQIRKYKFHGGPALARDQQLPVNLGGNQSQTQRCPHECTSSWSLLVHGYARWFYRVIWLGKSNKFRVRSQRKYFIL